MGLRSVCTNLGFLLDVGMYVPSKIFQASQQSVKLLSSPHQHNVDGKVSLVPPGLAEQCHPFSWRQRALAGLHGKSLVFAEGEYPWVIGLGSITRPHLVQGAGNANQKCGSPFPQSHTLYAEMSLPRDEDGNMDCKALVDQLCICPTLQEQADILYMLHILKYDELQVLLAH